MRRKRGRGCCNLAIQGGERPQRHRLHLAVSMVAKRCDDSSAVLPVVLLDEAPVSVLAVEQVMPYQHQNLRQCRTFDRARVGQQGVRRVYPPAARLCVQSSGSSQARMPLSRS
eukprot:1179743-Rhodomonas_salina.1